MPAQTCPFCNKFDNYKPRSLFNVAEHVFEYHLDKVLDIWPTHRLCWCSHSFTTAGAFASHCEQRGGVIVHWTAHHLGAEE